MISDVTRCGQRQIWFYDDHIDKTETDDNDYCVRGKRPVIILQTSGVRTTVLPISSSLTAQSKYKNLDVGIRFANRETPSYAIIDNVMTVNSSELEGYIGECKDKTFERIMKGFTEYINGNVVFSYKDKCYYYAYNRDEQEEYYEESEVDAREPKNKKGREYTDEEIEFILTHPTNECVEKFNVSASTIYGIRHKNGGKKI